MSDASNDGSSTVNASGLPDAGPPNWARAVAIAAIVVGGLCGGLIGWSVADLQCADGCTAIAAGSSVAGVLIGSIGVAIVAVLTLRAMAEWQAIENRDRARRARGLG